MAKILVVDDNVDMLETLEHLLTFYHFEVVKAQNGKEALEVALREEPGLIILDALMPVMNGFEACERLKSAAETKDIPVIFLSANYTEEEHRDRGLRMGADDYILKPFNAKELIAKINLLLNRKKLINKLRDDNRTILRKQIEFANEIDDMRKKAEELEHSDIIDALTGLYNNTCFESRLSEVHREAAARQQPLSIIFADIDFFQRVNDIYGEKTGDYVLMRVANVILNNTRANDSVFRIEKNRFGLILPDTDETGAFYEAERIRAAVQQTPFFDKDFFSMKRLSSKRRQASKNVTISLGVSTVSAGEERPELLRRALTCLTTAKSKGCNVTVRYSEIVSS